MSRSIRLSIAMPVLILAVCFLAQGHTQPSIPQLWETVPGSGGGNFGWSASPMGYYHVLVGQQHWDGPEWMVGRVCELTDWDGTIIQSYSGELELERLGISVAGVAGRFIVAGGRGDTDLKGIVRVFESGSSQDGVPIWSPDPESGGEFGCSVAWLGDVNGDGHEDFAVGASGENEGSGRVYVYTIESIGDIYQLHTINNPFPNIGHFGYSVSKGGRYGSDSYLVVVGTHDDSTGKALAFRDPDDYEDLWPIGAPPFFAHCVAMLEPPGRSLDEPKFAVGTPFDNWQNGQRVDLYNFDGTHFCTIDGVEEHGSSVGGFGYSISGSAWITGRPRWEFVVGSPSIPPEIEPTDAYVYQITAGSAQCTGIIERPNETYQRFGHAVAVTGFNWGIAVVGAPWAPNGGRVYGFEGEHRLAERNVEPGEDSTLGTQGEFSITPTTHILGPVLPNPFTESTTINYAVKEDGYASLRVFDLSGRVVRMLVDGTKAGGFHTVTWDGCDDGGFQLPQGAYMYSLDVNGFSQSRKTILVR